MEVRINGVKSKPVQTKSIHFVKERLIEAQPPPKWLEEIVPKF